jgi:hypothetical protein
MNEDWKVAECCEVCERVRDALAGADIGQDEGLAFDVAVLQAAWEEMHREAKQTRGAVETLERIRDHANSGDDAALLAQHELDRLRAP